MKRFSFFLYSAFLAVLLGSCGSPEQPAGESEEHGHEEAHENVATTTLTAVQMQSIGIELGSIESKQLTASIKANGTLKVPNQNRANATVLTGGVIKSILVQNGDRVSKGQTLATVANASFVVMQQDFLNTKSKMELAELELKRQRELQAGNAGAYKNLQQAESELKILRAQHNSLSKQLDLIGINANRLTADNIQSAVSVKSPISGTLSNVYVNIGTYVDVNTPIAEIIDNSQLHLDLYVYEKDLPKMKVGQQIHFTLTNNPGREYDAKVYAIGNTFETATKAVAVHATVEGDKTGLIDGMSITALISLEKATVQAVPTEAITSYQGQDYIFVVTDAHAESEHHEEEAGHDHDEEGHHHEEQEAPGHEEKGSLTFERIPVRKGTTEVGYSEITLLKDIPAHAKIVTKGAFFVLAKMTNSGQGHAH